MHVDGRLGGLGSEHVLEEAKLQSDPLWVLFQPKKKLNQTQ
jgi:hypothetical protein